MLQRCGIIDRNSDVFHQLLQLEQVPMLFGGEVQFLLPEELAQSTNVRLRGGCAIGRQELRQLQHDAQARAAFLLRAGLVIRVMIGVLATVGLASIVGSTLSFDHRRRRRCITGRVEIGGRLGCLRTFHHGPDKVQDSSKRDGGRSRALLDLLRLRAVDGNVQSRRDASQERIAIVFGLHAVGGEEEAQELLQPHGIADFLDLLDAIAFTAIPACVRHDWVEVQRNQSAQQLAVMELAGKVQFGNQLGHDRNHRHFRMVDQVVQNVNERAFFLRRRLAWTQRILEDDAPIGQGQNGLPSDFELFVLVAGNFEQHRAVLGHQDASGGVQSQLPQAVDTSLPHQRVVAVLHRRNDLLRHVVNERRRHGPDRRILEDDGQDRKDPKGVRSLDDLVVRVLLLVLGYGSDDAGNAFDEVAFVAVRGFQGQYTVLDQVIGRRDGAEHRRHDERKVPTAAFLLQPNAFEYLKQLQADEGQFVLVLSVVVVVVVVDLVGCGRRGILLAIIVRIRQ
mmetsp:Transcript_3291/g.9359  ORF Transcript_3291/g.9359 Transcript_3291/m.9359 type:complete len:507 (-) Transcript_3291:15-1535(-)